MAEDFFLPIEEGFFTVVPHDGGVSRLTMDDLGLFDLDSFVGGVKVVTGCVREYVIEEEGNVVCAPEVPEGGAAFTARESGKDKWRNCGSVVLGTSATVQTLQRLAQSNNGTESRIDI